MLRLAIQLLEDPPAFDTLDTLSNKIDDNYIQPVQRMQTSDIEAKYSQYTKGIDYIIKSDTQGTEYISWKNYDFYKKATEAQRQDVYNSASSYTKDIIDGYISEAQSRPVTYKTLNGLLRDNFFKYNQDGKITEVSFHGIYNNTSPMSLSDYIESIKYYDSSIGSAHEFLKENYDAIIDLDSFIRDNALQENMITYRGLQKLSTISRMFGVDTDTVTYDEFKKAVMDQKTFRDEGFLSTSVTQTAGPIAGAPVIFEFHNKKGTPAIDFANFGGIPGEQEVLIAPNTEYKYVDVVERDGKVVIVCELIDDFDYTKAGIELKNNLDKKFEKYYQSIPEYLDDRLKTDTTPSFTTTGELKNYITKAIQDINDGYDKCALAIAKYIEEKTSKNMFPTATDQYYELLNMYDLGLDPYDHSLVILKTINSSKSLRESISQAATQELESVFKNRFGFDDVTIKELKDSLLGTEFVEKGLGQGADWDKFIEIMEEPIQKQVQKSIDSGKEPVIWSSFVDEYHDLMDEKYTTISNTSIGGLNFIESIYTNWNSNATAFKTEDLWGRLSTTYAQACCEAVDSAGNELESIKFLYSKDVSVAESFGELFKTKELPEILSYDTIHTISLAKTDPTTMEVIDTIDIDISDICEYFGEKTDYSGYYNNAIAEKCFEMFLKKVKEEV